MVFEIYLHLELSSWSSHGWLGVAPLGGVRLVGYIH